jgi:zinc transporter ZupT
VLLKATRARTSTWLLALGPVVGLGLLLAAIVAFDPVSRLDDSPPVESVAVERTVLEPDRIVVHVRNDGAGPVTIAQVTVDDAFRAHTASPRTLDRLGTATVTIPYPWEEGVRLHLALLTSTGVGIPHEIEAASLTPSLDLGSLADYALLGLIIGVVPVALGLLWLPALRRASAEAVRFFLALTVGLLAFLLAETAVEGIELGQEAPSSLNGAGLFALGFLAVVVVMAWMQGALQRAASADDRAGGGEAPGVPLGGLGLAYLVAVGIGLHNLGEGLAVGAAVAAGEVALGTSLVVGFAAHNTTEGLAVAAPLANPGRRFPFRHLVALALVAGVPTVAGAWTGAFVTTPAWSALAFGVAAGAIAQVAWSVGRMVVGRHGVGGTTAIGFVCGLAVMYLTSLLVVA